MVSAKTKIINPMGMHMRPAQIFIKTITPFHCDITIAVSYTHLDVYKRQG